MTIKIYKPSKTSMQSGFKKTKLWLAEYISEVEIKDLDKKIRNEVSDAAEKAREATFPDKKELYEDIYKDKQL